MTSWWHFLGRGLLELLSPGCCHLCGRHVPQIESAFCAACRRELLTDSVHVCPRCAATIGPYALTAEGCVHCRKESFPFHQALRLGAYEQEGVLRDLVLRMKHPSGEFLARLIARLWLERDRARFEALNVDAAVPVPSHWLRRLWRGYDQVATLARELASQLRLPCERSWLSRIRHTPRQVGLKSTERQTNVKNAFAVRKGMNLKGRRILLIDDVMTTGATLREAARPLVRAGAAVVVVAVLARTPASS